MFCFSTATAILLYICNLQFALVYAIGLSYAGEQLVSSFLQFLISYDSHSNTVHALCCSDDVACLPSEVDSVESTRSWQQEQESTTKTELSYASDSSTCDVEVEG
jgi:hypothetical protein